MVSDEWGSEWALLIVHSIHDRHLSSLDFIHSTVLCIHINFTLIQINILWMSQSARHFFPLTDLFCASFTGNLWVFFHQDLAHLCVQVWRQAAWDWTSSNRYNRHNHFEVGRLGLHQGDGHLWCARNVNWEKVFHLFWWLLGAKVDTFFFG